MLEKLRVVRVGWGRIAYQFFLVSIPAELWHTHTKGEILIYFGRDWYKNSKGRENRQCAIGGGGRGEGGRRISLHQRRKPTCVSGSGSSSDSESLGSEGEEKYKVVVKSGIKVVLDSGGSCIQ